jgi:hypothetical protein
LELKLLSCPRALLSACYRLVIAVCRAKFLDNENIGLHRCGHGDMKTILSGRRQRTHVNSKIDHGMLHVQNWIAAPLSLSCQKFKTQPETGNKLTTLQATGGIK